VSFARLVGRARDRFARHGAIRTVGAIVEYCGVEFNSLCQSAGQILETDRGRGYPLSTRLRAARRGFSAHDYRWLGLDRTTTTDTYLHSPDAFREINDGSIEPLHNKYAFHLSTEPHLPMPTLYGTIDGGEFTAVGARDAGFRDILSAAGKLIVKPVDAGRGNGVCVVAREGEGYHLECTNTGAAGRVQQLSELDGYVVTEFVRQHDYAGSIFPETTNTVRIHSMAHPETGEWSLLRASHRFGTRESTPTDNWSQGAFVAPIDIRTGEIRELIGLEDQSRRRLTHHPESGERVAGVTVPHWDELCELVTEAAELHRFAPFVGWDVAVSRDGPQIIEANARPSVIGLQLTDGIFEDSAFRQFFRQHCESA